MHTDGAVSCWGHGFGDSPVRFDGFAGAVEIAASNPTICARWPDGEVRCTTFGQDTPPVVTRLALSRPAVAITGNCARSADGIVSCWDHELVPRDVADVRGAVRIASTSGYGCALDQSDQIACWTQGNAYRPFKAKLRDVEELAIADYHYACARHRDGAVTCWGEEEVPSPVPRKAVLYRRVEPRRLAGLRDVISLTGAAGRMCAVTKDGRASCWTAWFGAKPEIIEGLTDAVTVAVGERHACARTALGGVACWGQNDAGALGIGLALSRAKPEAVENIHDAVSIYAGIDHSCALRRGGTVSCWGKLAIMDEHSAEPIAREVAGLRGVAEIHGTIGLCVRYDNGTIACHDGPDRTHVAKPIAVPPASTFDGDMSGCALSNGSVYCWGSNRYGEFGNGTRGEDGKPARGASGIDDAAALAFGEFHTCVARKDGTLVTFGDDLGDDALGDSPDRLVLSPRNVPMPAPVISVSADLQSCCAVLRDGHVACLGRNDRGQLGDGTTTRRAAPIVVPGLEHVTKVSSRYDTSCALADGKVYCWGANGTGQVGPLGTSNDVLLPVRVSGLPEIVDVSTGGHHTCAVTRDGAVFCWGSTAHGESGIVASAERRAAVPVTFGR